MKMKSLALGTVVVLSIAALGYFRFSILPGPWLVGSVPEPPEAVETRPTYRSRVVVPVSVSHSGLAALIQNALPLPVEESKSISIRAKKSGWRRLIRWISIPVRGTVKVHQSSPVRVRQVGERLEASVDLQISGSVSNRSWVPHFSETARGAIRVNARIALVPGENGTPTPRVVADYEWLTRPSGDLFGVFPYSVGQAVGEKISEALRKLETEAAEQLSQSLLAPDTLNDAL